LRRDRRLRLPPAEWGPALPLPRLPEGFQHHVGHVVCRPQAALAVLLGGHCDLLQRGEGKSALALSRDLCVSYKTAFVLLHKLREAMTEEMRGRVIGGEGKIAEVDGGYFGGYIKPARRASTSTR
jgi:hypothetical protein